MIFPSEEFYRPWASEDEVIALFGQARLVKTIDGKLEIRGGSPEEQAQAREWQAMFLTTAETRKSQRP